MSDPRIDRRQALQLAMTSIATSSTAVANCAAAEAAPAGAASPKLRIPKGWFAAGSHPAEYLMGVDASETSSEGPHATLQSIVHSASGFGTLMQSISAENYRRKRIRFSGALRSANVRGWAGLWMRVDAGHKPVSFDNMQDRAVRATSEWTTYEIVLDVLAESDGISFGLLLAGVGQVWAKDLRFEVVDDEVPTTCLMHRGCSPLTRDPVNLNFTESSA